MNMKIKYIEVNQPIGTFYLAALDANTLINIVDIIRRSDNSKAVQRDASIKRINEIASYCEDVDATFPTPIIISIYEDANVVINDEYIEFDPNEKIGEVLDGQHRLNGISRSDYRNKFELPIILMFNLIDEEKAYVFSIINSKQTQVSMSLIYDLFDLSKARSPFKTCHETARGLNSDIESPFYNRLKMLGKKELGQEQASLSQGTFVKYMLELITKNADEDTRNIKNNKPLQTNKELVLRDYFIEGKDTVIYKVMFNLFTGVSLAFPNEWNNPDEYILSKSIGYGAILKAFPTIYKLGNEKKDLTTKFFFDTFSKVKSYIDNTLQISITSDHFGSNEQSRKKLADIIVNAVSGTHLF